MRPIDVPRVLVVDDGVEMAELIAEELSDRGYQAFSTPSGRAALQRLRAERIDALVTDIALPDVGGLELLRASIELDPMLRWQAIEALRGLAASPNSKLIFLGRGGATGTLLDLKELAP